MKQFFRSVFPDEFFRGPAHFRAFVLGMVYLGILLMQLFTFEKFPAVVTGYGVPGGKAMVAVVVVLIIVTEVIAMPYLISMRMGKCMHAVMRWAILAAPILWLILSLWLNFGPVADKTNTGILGATLATPVQLWLIAFSALWLWAAVLVMRELPMRKQK